MSCFYPKQAIRSAGFTKTGKRSIVFVSKRVADGMKGNPDLLSGLPCGQCVGCRLERSRQWAIRMMVEADCNANNLVDLDNMSLSKRDFQLFFKRFRKAVDVPLRYYMCGEYGDRFGRPHYHAIIFGYDFPDKIFEDCKDGMQYFSSPFLFELWPYGSNIITDVTFDTCAYVARYIMKKVTGKLAFSHYDDGQLLPEYTTMSRRPGIGKFWL